MKKRVMAALLAVVMLFGMLPMSVFAENGIDTYSSNKSVPLTLNISSYGAPFLNGSTGQHTVNSYKAYKNISRADVGSDNASGSATARFVGSNENGWTLVIDVVVGDYSDTWTTNARITNKDMSAATGNVTFGLSFNTSGGTSTYVHISGAKALPHDHNYKDWKDNGNGTHTGKCDCGETTTENHVDDNQDGICDKCKTCLHTKDEKGNCTLGKDCKHIKDGLGCCKYEEEPEAKYTYHLYYDFNYTGTGSTKWDIVYGPTAETSHTYKVDSQTLTCREGYTHLGWADTADATEAKYHGGDEITRTKDNSTKTIYAVWEKVPEFDKDKEIENMQVKVQCQTVAGHARTYDFGDLTGCYQATPLGKQHDGKYHYTVTLDRAAVVTKFSGEINKEHEDADSDAITNWSWTWDADNKIWKMDNAPATSDAWATIYVECEPEPTTVNVYVGLVDSTGATLNTADFRSDDFGEEIVENRYHVGALTTTQTLSDLTADPNGDGLEKNDPVRTFVYQQMAKVNPAPGYETNWTPAEGVAAYFEWARQIRFTELKKQDDGTYNLYGQIIAYKLSLDLDGGTLTEDTVSGYYLSGSEVTLPQPTKSGYKFLGWTEKEGPAPDPDDSGVIVLAAMTAIDQPQKIAVSYNVTYVANWEKLPEPNVHIMVFKSNDLNTPVLDAKYTGTEKIGDTIDLTALDAHTYLKAAGKDFTFEIDAGWYNDGLFNDYKDNNIKKDALTSLLVTGEWQNLKLVVTEMVPVVYFLSAEALKAYQGDHSKTEGILGFTTARVGSKLPTADAPTATRPGYTFKFWSREGQSTDVSGQTVNGWTNLYANWEKKSYNVVAKLKVNGELAYDPNDALYTQTVSGKFEEAIDFAPIKAWALDLAENTVHPGAASYTVEYEDGTEASLCSTYGQHEIDQETHTIYVNVKTTEHVYVYRMVDGVMQPTEYHHSEAPYGTNVIAYLNENVKNLDMEEYTHDEWFKKDGSALGAKFEQDETIHGRTDVVIQYTKAEYPVTYSYVSADPAIALPQAVLDTRPTNEYTYELGQEVPVAQKPETVEVGENVWTFKTWKVGDVEVVPGSKVPMPKGGLTIVGVWECTRKEYGVTYSYVSADPAIALPQAVLDTRPTNEFTYTTDEWPETAAKPDDVIVGEYVWKFVTWKFNGIEVAPRPL